MATLLFARAVAGGISLYQRHLSPRKGFVCAHRVLYGGLSCSEAVRQAALNGGVRAALRCYRERMQMCRNAALEIRRRRATIRMSEDATEGGDENPAPPSETTPYDDPPPDPTSTPVHRRHRRGGGSGGGCSQNDLWNAWRCGRPLSHCGHDADCAMSECHAPNCEIPSCDAAHCQMPSCDGLNCDGLNCDGLNCDGLNCDGCNL